MHILVHLSELWCKSEEKWLLLCSSPHSGLPRSLQKKSKLTEILITCLNVNADDFFQFDSVRLLMAHKHWRKSG